MNPLNKKTTLMIIVLILTIHYSFASEGNGGQGGAFLRMPIGARPAGMGNAFVSIADDANAMYFNIAGLYQIKTITFGAMYSLMSMDRRHYQGSLIYSNPTLGALGVMFTGFGVTDIDGRDKAGNSTGKFDDSEMAFSIGYGRQLFSFIGIGVGFKYLHHSLQNQSASGMGYDAGLHSNIALRSRILKRIRLGLGVSNIAAKFKWDTVSSHQDEIPFTARLGASMDLQVQSIKVTTAFDATQTATESIELHAGAETWFFNVLGIRAGLDGSDFTYGASLRIIKFEIDYAFSPDVIGEGATQKVGMQIML